MSKRNIAEEIRIDYHNNTNMDRLTCKQTFTSSDNDFLMSIGFEKNKLPGSLTIWHKTYMEDVDGCRTGTRFKPIWRSTWFC